jgi:hypothetical protein
VPPALVTPLQVLQEHYEGQLEPLLGELQFSFLAFVYVQSLDGYVQWKQLLLLLLGCEDAALHSHQDGFVKVGKRGLWGAPAISTMLQRGNCHRKSSVCCALQSKPAVFQVIHHPVMRVGQVSGFCMCQPLMSMRLAFPNLNACLPGPAHITVPARQQYRA